MSQFIPARHSNMGYMPVYHHVEFGYDITCTGDSRYLAHPIISPWAGKWLKFCKEMQ